jgi:hypothetical protein
MDEDLILEFVKVFLPNYLTKELFVEIMGT